MSEKTPSTPASDRAREAWESMPGDSEAAVDYPDRPLTVDPLAVNLSEYHELTVEISVRTPDGTSFTYGERIECRAEDDYTFDEALVMLDAAHRVITNRITG